MDIFGVPHEGANRIEVEISHSPGCAEVKADGLSSISIVHALIPPEPFDLKRFAIFPCFTGATRASEVMRLQFKGEYRPDTFGFVFPVTSFRNESEFQEEYLLVYADAAFKGFLTLENLSKFQSDQKWKDISGSSLELDEALSDNLSILAISKEICEKVKVSGVLLDFVLRKEGISICNTANELSLSPPIVEFSENITIRLPKITKSDDLEVLATLLKNADQDNSEIGKFIQYYQFFEYMLKLVFEWGIPEASGEGLSAWAVRERLTQLGGEKHRLSLIDRVCSPGHRDTASRHEAKAACAKFLSLISADFKKEQPWYSLLYRVRSCIVHDQFSMLRSEYIRELGELNSSLRKVALDVLFYFEKPSFGQIFSSEQKDSDSI